MARRRLALTSPNSPRAPRAPRLPPARLRLSPLREPASIALDVAEPRGPHAPDAADLPVFVPWEQFLATFEFEQGQHITMVGATGSGKTTLALRMLDYRAWVCVLATKNRDPSLYPELLRKGYRITDNPELDWTDDSRLIFRPKLEAPTTEARVEQREAFRKVLVNIFNEGGWCLYGDEVRYLTQNLGLGTELETLWLQGRSLGISMVVSTQRPVSIPVIAFESATHLFLFRATDRANIQRAAEFSSSDADVIRFTLPRLPRYEVLHIDTRTGAMVRTKVKL